MTSPFMALVMYGRTKCAASVMPDSIVEMKYRHLRVIRANQDNALEICTGVNHRRPHEVKHLQSIYQIQASEMQIESCTSRIDQQINPKYMLTALPR